VVVLSESLESIVAQWAGRRLGFDARALRLERLMAAAREQVQRLGSVEALGSALGSGERTAEDALVAAATVGETYFFRQHEHFDLLSELRLPASCRLTAWSAGCSSGEEAYSLAGALRQRFGLEAPALTVWGTDINPKALEAARRADYGRWSWRQGDEAEAARRALALAEETKACVRFARHNLLDSPVFDLEGKDPSAAPGERFDLVFCRNVLVYFTPQNAAQAVERLRTSLRPGGWLVLGNMDLGGQPQGFKRVGPAALCAYEKLAVAPAVAVPAAPVPALVPAPGPQAAPKALAALDPVEWHRAVLAELETGHSAQALQELQLMVESAPDYIPGLFEHALALRRSGKDQAAAASLQRLLKLAHGRALSEPVEGPEPLSLEFYVNSAHSFLDSAGGLR
jgi:chemotaxis protein methyltransferase CheR